MYAEFAIWPGTGLPLRRGAARFGLFAMTVPRANATAAAAPQFVGFLRDIVERRDQNAFAALFDYYAPRVKAYLKRLGSSDSLADDLAQEAMLAVWRKAENYDPAKAAVGTWIFTIARNLRIDSLRRERRPELEADDALQVPDPAPLPDRVAEVAQEENDVRTALKDLPQDQAEVIQLAFYEGKSHGEIAAALMIPLGTVKSRLRLAFRRVRGRLGAHV
jgi:RNA polymerase sigma factor (sigma-70 family)